jgi:hypothetical protein
MTKRLQEYNPSDAFSARELRSRELALAEERLTSLRQLAKVLRLAKKHVQGIEVLTEG